MAKYGEEEIACFETALRELISRYELYFNGSERRAPLELQQRVDTLAQRIIPAQISNTALRYRFNNALARLCKYRELWTRNQRRLDDGRQPARQAPAAAKPALAPKNNAQIEAAWRELDRQCSAAGLTTPPLAKMAKLLGDKLASVDHGHRISVSVCDGKAKIKIEPARPVE